MKYKMPFTDRDFSLVNETKTDGGKNPKNTKKDELIKELEGLKGLADSVSGYCLINCEFISEIGALFTISMLLP